LAPSIPSYMRTPGESVQPARCAGGRGTGAGDAAARAGGARAGLPPVPPPRASPSLPRAPHPPTPPTHSRPAAAGRPSALGQSTSRQPRPPEGGVGGGESKVQAAARVRALTLAVGVEVDVHRLPPRVDVVDADDVHRGLGRPGRRGLPGGRRRGREGALRQGLAVRPGPDLNLVLELPDADLCRGSGATAGGGGSGAGRVGWAGGRAGGRRVRVRGVHCN
jgi:hypothetical protein